MESQRTQVRYVDTELEERRTRRWGVRDSRIRNTTAARYVVKL